MFRNSCMTYDLPFLFCFLYRFDNTPYQEAQLARRNMIEHTDLEPVSCVYLFQLFPFAIAFDRTMTIRQVGEKSRELFGGEEMVGLPVETFFLMHRPRVSFTWDNVSIVHFCLLLSVCGRENIVMG